MMTKIRTREAREGDIEAIREIFLGTYEEDYPYRDFYDRDWLKKAIYGDHMVMVVAEDGTDGTVLGTGSVDLDVGTHSDLVGEFGRLAVRPESRGKGVGGAIMARRIQLMEGRLHVGIVGNRTVHFFSQRISHRFGFAAVGFLPLKHRFRTRESIAPFAHHFGPALALRRNHPRVVPPVDTVAHLAMTNLAMGTDVIVDESAPPFPRDDDFESSELESERMPDLLRIERGRVRAREVFGPIRLHYGFFKLTARKANYLVARRPGVREGAVAGALGFLHDPGERNIRIFELIAASDASIRYLFVQLLERARALEAEYIEVDVNAHGTRLQRTLLEIGFLPAAYYPALAFHDVERLDAVTMVRLLVPPVVGEVKLIDPVQPLHDAVMAGFRSRSVLPRIADRMDGLSIFSGLGDEQARWLASSMSVKDYGPGEELFRQGDPADELYVLMDGEVEVRISADAAVGRVGEGGTVGENAMLADTTHNASVRTRAGTVVAVLTRASLQELATRRPDIAVILYRNLAVGLGEKLSRAGMALDRRPSE
jgi:GNAT superfamily N-acetyltransferase